MTEAEIKAIVDGLPESARRYLTVADMAVRYSIAQRTVWEWAKQGRLPKPVKVEGRTVWWLPDLVAWEAAQGFYSSPQPNPQ